MTAQQPELLLVTCSDSRIVPHAITHTAPGQLFVVRNAGNMLPAAGSGSAEEATIEYGIDVLGIRDLVVCGHSQCGAMTGLLGIDFDHDDSALAHWLRNAIEVRRHVEANHADESLDQRVQRAVEHNAITQIERAKQYPAVRNAIARGTLRLHAWFNHLASARFFAYDETRARYVPVESEASA